MSMAECPFNWWKHVQCKEMLSNTKENNLEILYIYFIFVSQWVLFNVYVNFLNFIGIKQYCV